MRNWLLRLLAVVFIINLGTASPSHAGALNVTYTLGNSTVYAYSPPGDSRVGPISIDFKIFDFHGVYRMELTCGSLFSISGSHPYGSWSTTGGVVASSEYLGAFTGSGNVENGSLVPQHIGWKPRIYFESGIQHQGESCVPVLTTTDRDGNRMSVKLREPVGVVVLKNMAPANPTPNLESQVPSPTVPAASSNVFVGDLSGRLISSNTTLGLSGSPYRVTSTIQIAASAELVIEPGVEIEVAHNGPVFSGAGTVSMEGTPQSKVRIKNANILWQPSNDVNSSLIATNTVFSNLGGFMPVEVYSIGTFSLESCYSVGRGPWGQFKSLVTNARIFKLSNSYFENLPGFEVQKTGRSNDYRIDGNWFQGNSATNVPSWGMAGEWVLADSLNSFEGNTFTGFTGPVIFKLWSSEILHIETNYFDGLSNFEMLQYVRKDPIGRTWAGPSDRGWTMFPTTISPGQRPSSENEPGDSTPETGPAPEVVSFGFWTRRLNATEVKMYAKNPVGVGKIQFKVNGVEIAWVRAENRLNAKLRRVDSGPMAGASYLVRTVKLVPGKNAFEIYRGGSRLMRTAYSYTP
jgi:hypothetical protein